jgi:ribosomal protein L11 methyltransferase
MSWILVRAHFQPAPLDFSPIVDIFRLYGVENTLESDQTLEGCISQVDGSERVADQLKQALLAAGAREVAIEPYVEQDWETTWKQFFKPRRVGRRLVIVPSWETYPSEESDIVLVLDPGQAFGTGDHPTTRMCLELLEGLSLSGKRLADVGCGSGILGIYASKVGADVVAVDIDPVALEVTRDNAARNQVRVESYCGDGLHRLVAAPSKGELSCVPQDESLLKVDFLVGEPASIPVGKKFDVVVSNIISATLIRIGDQIAEVLERDGVWILSGVIEANWPDVGAAALRLGFQLQRRLSEDGWVAASLVSQPTMIEHGTVP